MAAEQRLAALSARAKDAIEQATVACLRVDLYVTLDQSGRAVAVGLEYLRHLGIEWSPHPTAEEAPREYERIWSTLGDRSIEALDRAAFDERPDIPRHSGCSDQTRGRLPGIRMRTYFPWSPVGQSISASRAATVTARASPM